MKGGSRLEIEQLVKACQKGDRQAFEELIRLFFPYVSGFLLKLTPDVSLAEDLTQETFLKMIRGIDRFDTRRRAVSPWPGWPTLPWAGGSPAWSLPTVSPAHWAGPW